MNRCLSVIPLLVNLLSVLVMSASAAEMSSTNYRITTTVMSGSSGRMGSSNFQMNSTLGQPSPLIEQGMDPYSDNYGLLPGFWYTLTPVALDFCECNLNTDSSCNILDYQLFIQKWGATNCNDPGVYCACDLNADGKCNILDYQVFIQDWGRTDCP